MPSDLEDEIDTLALKRLEYLQRQKMIDLFGFDPDSRDSAPPKKLKKRALSHSDNSASVASLKKPRSDSNLPKDPSHVLDSKKTKKCLGPTQAAVSQPREKDKDFFAGAQRS